MSESLGHGSIAITLDTYSAYVPTLGSQAADAIEKARKDARGPRRDPTRPI